MGFEYLRLFEVIIILAPNSNSVIIAAAYESTVINPFYEFDIVGMSLQNILTFILISSRIESPNPDIFISTA